MSFYVELQARARIFCNELGGKSGDDESDFENSSSGESSGPSPARLEGKRKVEEALQDSPSKSAIDFPSAVKSLAMKPEKEKDVLMGPKLISATSFSSSNGNGGSRVAIFRDREKDRRDPDYDRNTTRYLYYYILLIIFTLKNHLFGHSCQPCTVHLHASHCIVQQ